MIQKPFSAAAAPWHGFRTFRARTVYDVVIYMHSGETRRLTLESVVGLHEGAEVEIRDGRVVPA